MKLNISKRTVAREVLIFFGSAIAVLILFSLAWCNNKYYDNKISSARIQISILSDNQNQLPTAYIWDKYQEAKGVFFTGKPLGNLNNPTDIDWSDIPDESISIMPVSYNEFEKLIQTSEYIKKLGANGIAVSSYLVNQGVGYNHDVSVKQMEYTKRISGLLNVISDYSSKKYAGNGIGQYVAICIVVIVIVVYGLRFCIMAIWWSIQVFRNNDNSPQKQQA